MTLFKRILFYLLGIIILLFILYFYIATDLSNETFSWYYNENFKTHNVSSTLNNKTSHEIINIWNIFTKVTENSPMQVKFNKLIKSLLVFTTVPLHLHIICDNSSKVIAERIINKNKSISKVIILYSFYDVKVCAQKIIETIKILTPHFSSRPGTYYSDALFYLSLGLHKIATNIQTNAIMLDCDVQFMKDVSLLYNQFNKFKSSNLFGLSYELTPVYRHVLYAYRNHQKTSFGEYVHSKQFSKSGNHLFGFPGFNSGVMLFNFSAIRESNLYRNILSVNNVERLVDKYKFKGHLGDQDFYTILGYEYPELFYILPCNFNRQLCVWWRDHGYSDIFNKYSRCDGDVIVYHGNCNTPIPVQ